MFFDTSVTNVSECSDDGEDSDAENGEREISIDGEWKNTGFLIGAYSFLGIDGPELKIKEMGREASWNRRTPMWLQNKY